MQIKFLDNLEKAEGKTGENYVKSTEYIDEKIAECRKEFVRFDVKYEP